jgi:mannose-6-phosphate isomerase-like protein (cupin superfamily)
MTKAIEKIVFSEMLALFTEHQAPKIVGEVNDFQVKLVKFLGTFVWHSHEKEDELFIVLKGRLKFQFPDRVIELNPGEGVIAPRGIPHCPIAEEEVHVLLIEPKTTVNAGSAAGPKTRQAEWLLGGRT